jgi:hypothetical protein
MSSVKQTGLQLVTLRTGEEIRTVSATWWNFRVIQRLFPRDLHRFTNDRQFLDSMLPLTEVISSVHIVIFWLSIPLCLLFAWTRRFARMNNFLASAILFSIFNAAVCSALVGVYSRYQCRVSWIMPFCLTTYICCLVNERKREFARQDSSCL